MYAGLAGEAPGNVARKCTGAGQLLARSDRF